MMLVALGAASLTWLVLPSKPVVAVVVGGLFVAPATSIAGGLGAVARRRIRASRHLRQAAIEAEAAVIHLARNLSIALAAGLAVPAALDHASRCVYPVLRAEVEAVLRAARSHGLAVALADAGGHAGRLMAVLARAQASGAGVRRAVASFIEERNEIHRQSVTERARKLPVKLTVPLALLILPGFVIVTVGPSVIESVRRLLGPLLP